MQILMVLLCTVTSSAQNIIKKKYNQDVKGGTYIFSAMSVFFAMLFFVLFTKKAAFPTDVLPFALGFALTYSVATAGSLLAIKTGSLALTSLIISYSLVIPTLYGIIALQEQSTPKQYIGMGILMVSLFLIRSGEENKEQKRKISSGWVLYVLLGFLGNGFCALIQNAQQKKFDGVQNGNFMITALAVSFVVLLIMAILFEKQLIKVSVKKGVVLFALCGIANGATNLLVMLSVAIMASSVFFPTLSAASLILTFIISVTLYKEKLLPRQVIAFVLGIAAIVLLS